MSGGSWDYSFIKMKECAEALLEDRTLYAREKPDLNEKQRSERHRLGALLLKVAAAMKAIEWVDSSDSSTPADIDAIEDLDAALGAPPEAVAKLLALWTEANDDEVTWVAKPLEEALRLLDPVAFARAKGED